MSRLIHTFFKWIYLLNKNGILVQVFFLRLVFKKVALGNNIIFNGRPFLRLYGETIIGNNVVFNSNTKYNTVGIFKNCSVFVAPEAKLRIGDNTGFSGCSIHCENNIKIGSYCNFGGNVSIWDTDFHPINFLERRKNKREAIISKQIVIGNDVFVGANSIILKGVTIGDRAVIGAGTIVTSDIPKDEIWAGNPARYIKKIKV